MTTLKQLKDHLDQFASESEMDSQFESSMTVIWNASDDLKMKWFGLYSYYMSLDFDSDDPRINDVSFLMSIISVLDESN